MHFSNYTFTKYGLQIFLMTLVFCACENNEKQIPNLRDKRTGLDEGHQIVVYMSEGAKLKGKLTSPLMYSFVGDSSYHEFPKTLHVDFYNDSFQIESKLDAKYGKYREWEKKVFLKDSVVVINILKGDTLRCDELWWNQNTQKLYTDKPARYTGKDGFVNYGRNGLEAKQDLSDLVFYNNAGTLPVPKDSLQ
jgi:LPS export ABC transporter protein LptC